MREIKTSLKTVLSLISCANDYGFKNDVLFDAFKGMLNNKLTNEEIETYARSVEAMEGYCEEDYKEIRERLNEFKNKYCS